MATKNCTICYEGDPYCLSQDQPTGAPGYSKNACDNAGGNITPCALHTVPSDPPGVYGVWGQDCADREGTGDPSEDATYLSGPCRTGPTKANPTHKSGCCQWYAAMGGSETHPMPVACSGVSPLGNTGLCGAQP